MKKKISKKHKKSYYYLKILIFFSIISAISIIYWKIKERLSNEKIIEYVNKEIKNTIKEKSINDSISLNLQKLDILCDILCDSFSIKTMNGQYDKCECFDTTIIIKKILKNRSVDIVVKKGEYVIYFFYQYITKKGRQFGVIFPYYPYESFVITQEMFPEFEIIRNKQIPQKKEKWIYVIDNYWVIYVP